MRPRGEGTARRFAGRPAGFRTGLAAVVLLALVVRLAALAATPHLNLSSDPLDYSRHATSIAHGHGYPASSVALRGGPSAYRPPGFPGFLAGVYAVTGDSVTAGRVAQALLGAVVVALTALIAAEVWGGGIGLLAGLLAAVFPPLVIDGMTLLSEPLFVALELAAVLATLRARRDPRLRWIALAGAAVGLAVLTRANGVLLLLPLLVAARGPGPWGALASYRRPAVMVACATLVVVPWTIRNAVELHAFVPVSTQDGYTAVGTYNETSRRRDGVWLLALRDPEVNRLIAASRTLDEVALDAKLRSHVRRYIVDHPGYLLTVAFHNTLRLFNLAGMTYERRVARGDYGLGSGWARLMVIGLLPFLALAVVGAFTRAARQAPRWMWAVPVLMLAPVMILAQNRARAPIDPFLIMLAALALAMVVARLRS